ncbi:DNA cytosine methyltransferase [Prauserella endophytica]|uniref:DNA (cytosine-5-)-methyltransferase n=1 Tax=Prauserella endophytica TaxID=1592324 RepID=A0ABY2RVM7_9PSEU|nr:DNA cytosine methyltransferase [Prauserella endophytica]TKG61544.1 DNA cytosine methyltransferase [Prauserella endophytica]
MSLTFTDIFCGAGGSSIGLTGAGFELKLAANHWPRAIETHAKNFRDAEHLCADVSNYDMRRLPSTDILWASPICTEISPAGGRKRSRAQLDLLEQGPIAQAGFEKTRATFMDVIRAAEVHRYKAVLVENVTDVASDWELFDWWVNGMKILGYNVQFTSVSSAHVGDETNPHAPQWRDRLYMTFTLESIPLPDVTPRPLAWCQDCDEQVNAVQSWRNDRRRKIGKYRQQYDYRCPNRACRHSIVEPYVLPAAAAVDWSDIGERIGDKRRPLRPSTLKRIAAGLEMFCAPTMVTVTHGKDSDGRAYPAHGAPLPTRTVKIGDGLAVPGYLVPSGGTWRNDPTTLHNPMPARTTRENDALVCPPFVTVLRNHGTATRIDAPLTTVSAGGNHHGLTVPPGATIPWDPNTLVIPYRKGATAHRTDRPLSTLATREQHGVLRSAIEVEDCFYRMMRPREQLRAQRFHDTYEVTGNIGEQTMQAGNAVSANVPQWLGRQVAKVL